MKLAVLLVLAASPRMDRGNNGAFCDSTIDCGGGLWCKDRGDGVKACMR
jgi:hypothetical protein